MNALKSSRVESSESERTANSKKKERERQRGGNFLPLVACCLWGGFSPAALEGAEASDEREIVRGCLLACLLCSEVSELALAYCTVVYCT